MFHEKPGAWRDRYVFFADGLECLFWANTLSNAGKCIGHSGTIDNIHIESAGNMVAGEREQRNAYPELQYVGNLHGAKSGFPAGSVRGLPDDTQ